MTDIPDRMFVDDLGRRWEWCGGESGTWAWRITDIGNRLAVAEIQQAIVTAMNAVGATLLGSSFSPFESSPISDDEIADMLNGIRRRQMLEECLPTGVAPTPENMLRYYGIRPDRHRP
jgi:hypothetical protein